MKKKETNSNSKTRYLLLPRVSRSRFVRRSRKKEQKIESLGNGIARIVESGITGGKARRGGDVATNEEAESSSGPVVHENESGEPRSKAARREITAAGATEGTERQQERQRLNVGIMPSRFPVPRFLPTPLPRRHRSFSLSLFPSRSVHGSRARGREERGRGGVRDVSGGSIRGSVARVGRAREREGARRVAELVVGWWWRTVVARWWHVEGIIKRTRT